MAKYHLTEDERSDDLLTAQQVANLLGVDPKTVSRWAAAGKLACIRTVGGHRRYRRSTIEPYLNPLTFTEEDAGEGEPV